LFSSLGWIAFVSTRDGAPYIYTDLVSSSTVRRLAPGENPSWYPDGTRIVFNDVATGDSDPVIRVMNADGSDQHALPVRGTQPTWSPDGIWLAYATQKGIYIAGADGSNPVRFADSPVPGDTTAQPAWSPDGESIAFVYGAHFDGWSIVVWRRDSSAVRSNLITDRSCPNRTSPTFAPDGQQLAFICGGSVYTMAVDGTALQLRADAGPGDSRVDWGGSATQLSFAKFPAGSARQRIFITDFGTGETSQLIPDATGASGVVYDDYQATRSPAFGPWDYSLRHKDTKRAPRRP
jgi:Tol biopolymer transport system component